MYGIVNRGCNIAENQIAKEEKKIEHGVISFIIEWNEIEPGVN